MNSSTKWSVRQATPDDAEVIVELVDRLLIELGGTSSLTREHLQKICQTWLQTGIYTGFVAYHSDNSPIGILTVVEVCALYAGGPYGLIQELFIDPECRSLGVGHVLLKQGIAWGKEQNWSRLEVNTPEIKRWQRTIKFYQQEGFTGDALHLRLAL